MITSSGMLTWVAFFLLIVAKIVIVFYPKTQVLKATPTTVGRYERDEVKPSIEVAAKTAALLEVSLDYLVGITDHYLKDQKMLHRLEELNALTDYDKERILYTLDGLLCDVEN